MIGRLTGTLVEKNPPALCLDVQGVGYEVDVPMSTFYALPEVGGRVTLLTHLLIREDAHVLYGFATADERMAFRELIRVTGIGARIALALLSGMTVSDLARAVTLQETTALLRVPGIGKKTAERLLLEMRGRLDHAAAPATDMAPSEAAPDMLNALLALGYSEKEARQALRDVPAGTPVSDGIRQALKVLGRQ